MHNRQLAFSLNSISYVWGPYPEDRKTSGKSGQAILECCGFLVGAII